MHPESFYPQQVMATKTGSLQRRPTGRTGKSRATRTRSRRRAVKLSYVGVLPYAVDEGKRYYLVGREKHEDGWDGSGKWSDFGGDPEGDSAVNGAAREFHEETMGFFGSERHIRTRLAKSKRFRVPGGYMYLLRITYDPHAPSLFRRIHGYIMQCDTRNCPDGLFEKTSIRWVGENELRDAMNQNENRYRPEFLESLKSVLNDSSRSRSRSLGGAHS